MATPCSPSTRDRPPRSRRRTRRRDSMSRFISLSSTSRIFGIRLPRSTAAGPAAGACARSCLRTSRQQRSRAERCPSLEHPSGAPCSRSSRCALLGASGPWRSRRRRDRAPAASWRRIRSSELEAVHLRHHQVEQDQRRRAARASRSSAARPFSASRHGRSPPSPACGAACSRVVGIVLDDQHRRRLVGRRCLLHRRAAASRSIGLVR